MSPHAVEGSLGLAEIIGKPQSESFPPLWNCLSGHAITNSNRPAIRSFHQPVVDHGHAQTKPATDVLWTYSELHCNADCLAARLSNLGVQKGDAIAAFIDNRAEWALLSWASVRLDAVFVPLNPRVVRSKEELNHVLRITKPRVMAVIDESTAREFEVVATHLTAMVSIRIILESADSGLAIGWTAMSSLMSISTNANGTSNGINQGSMRSPVNDLDQIMVIIFTSGTTSLPKASVSTYGNVLAGALALKALRHLNPGCTLLQHLPAFHAWSICVSWAFWVSGATVVYPARTFDARSSLSAIESALCTHMPAVPSMIQALVTHPSLSDTKLDSLLSIDLAGTMIAPEIVEACMDKIKAPYSSVIYGMTEGSAVCGSDMEDIPYARHSIPKIISCGKAAPGGRLRVCKPGSRDVLRRGEIGELHMGGLQVTRGYLDRASDDFYQEDGINWLATGDQARIDDTDLVYILGRYKDLIIRGGENISPASIEQCLDSIEGIKDSQVVGLADEIAGEIPVAVVRKSSALNLSDYQIQQRVSNELGMMFSPQHILDLLDLGLADYPRTTSGKIKKGDLKVRVGEHLSWSDAKQKDNHVASTVDILIRFWACVSGRVADDITPDECADTFADSIMIMQFCNLVCKDLGKTIAVEDIVGDVSISKQAQIIDARPATERSNREVSRPGPPTAADMVHVNGDMDAATRCQQKVESLLPQHGLRWKDVEDVIPTAQTVALMTRRTRLRNWNRRHAYHVPDTTTAGLRWAVATCLGLHPTFRSLILDHGQAQPLYVILRPHDRWYRLAISEGHAVETPEDLKALHFDSDSIDHAIPPGPLFKFLLVDVRNTKGTGLIICGHHSTFDALSMGLFFEDLDTALRTQKAPKPHASFKEFADRKCRYLDSPNADTAVAFHVKRLQGYTHHRNALWPPQRAPQFFRGSDSQWTQVDGTPGQPSERRILDSSPQGVNGINGSITLPFLTHLKTTCGITANIVFKAALALLNAHHTGTTQAFFGAAEAARVWPTTEGEPDPSLPNTMDIPGPTWEVIVNRIHIDRQQPLLLWLQDLQDEQALLTKYASAPFQRIENELAATTDPHPTTSHELHDSFFRRQCFNWLPPSHSNFTNLEQIQSLSRADIGLQWNFMHVDAEKGQVAVNAAYDDCQMTSAEMKEAVEEVLEAARWIVEALDGERGKREGEGKGVKVGECPLLN
ncbi:MAG: hypothetical protein L6R38_008876 [Xanthoria sp. 2 TBL-2021]|nr:MAG: hypothetical protein L6R38_008876 [Xanthoria sp. 2 TBL-2021]